jgi:hypothetical protein
MKNKETKKIRECYQELKWAFDSVSYHKHPDRALELSLKESKSHDNFRGDSISRGISILTEAKYFVIKRVFEYASGTNPPKAEDYFSIQTSCFACVALAHSPDCAEYTAKWLRENSELIAEIVSWDYCDLIQTEDRRRGFKSSPVEVTSC